MVPGHKLVTRLPVCMTEHALALLRSLPKAVVCGWKAAPQVMTGVAGFRAAPHLGGLLGGVLRGALRLLRRLARLPQQQAIPRVHSNDKSGHL